MEVDERLMLLKEINHQIFPPDCVLVNKAVEPSWTASPKCRHNIEISVEYSLRCADLDFNSPSIESAKAVMNWNLGPGTYILP